MFALVVSLLAAAGSALPPPGPSLLALAGPTLPAGAAEIFVAPGGNDAWEGTRARPLATLERAIEKARSTRGATVRVRAGVYRLRGALKLDERDNGLTIASYAGEKPRVTGGQTLKRFRPVRDNAVLARLAPEARAHVLECDLAAEGVSDAGRFTSRGFSRPTSPAHLELFYGGKRMTVARWPNEGFLKIKAAADPSRDDEHGGKIGRLEAGFYFDGTRPSRWKSLENIWVHGYWTWDWANSYEEVDTIDAATGLLRTRAPYGVYGFRAGQRFYFLNVLEELDSPGEYYVDRAARKLYFWPPKPGEEAAVPVLEEPLVQVRDGQGIVIRGLTFEFGRANGIEVEGGAGVRIEKCTVRNVGNTGIIVNGGARHAIADSDVYQVGDSGVQISGGDRKTLTPAGHEAVNNHIHHMGEWSRTYQPAISVSGVGVRIANNLIHDGPHSAIQLSGNDHVIEYNEIHHVALETGDVGAFYMGRDYTMRGNIVRYNYFHETGGVGMGSMGVYLDDCASGTTVVGNIFYKVTRAVFIGGGRDNTVENNVFVDSKPAVAIDGRGLDPRPVWHNQVYATLKERLAAMNYREPPYSTRYPELAALDKYYEGDKGVPPEGNRVLRNICYGGSWLDIRWHADPAMAAVDGNLVGQDPLFVDAARLNFQLRPESPAFKLGFKRIPVEKIGIKR